MHLCRLQDILSPEQLKILGEVVDDALEQAHDTLRLHEEDDLGFLPEGLGEKVEIYLEMIALQSRRLAIIKELLVMIRMA